MSNQDFNSLKNAIYSYQDQQYLGKNQQYLDFPKIGNFQNSPIGKLTLKNIGNPGIRESRHRDCPH